MNLKLLYSAKEINKYLKPFMKIDIFDDSTIKHYEKKYLTDLTEKDLEIMLNTIEDQSVSLNTSQSFGIGAYNALISGIFKMAKIEKVKRIIKVLIILKTKSVN